MDKKIMALIGIGVLGIGSFVIMSQGQPTYQSGGVSGGLSKKEIIGPTETTETVTEAPVGPGDIIYNIVFPDPSFPAIPQAPVTEPWWVKSLDPPVTNTGGGGGRRDPMSFLLPSAPSVVVPPRSETTKKATNLRLAHAPGWGVFASTPSGSKGLVEYTEARTETKKSGGFDFSKSPSWIKNLGGM